MARVTSSSSDSRLDRVRSVLRLHLRELSARRPAIYWADLLTSAALGWSALVLGCIAASRADIAALPLFVVAVLALYRASSFMHEIAHMRTAVRGFDVAWNALIGVPLLFPSLLYTGVHTTHHAREVFGTDRDPEYANLEGAAQHARVLGAFLFVPVVLLLRWLVVGPLSLVHPTARRFVVERLSSFAGNAAYRRPAPRGRERTMWIVLELACFAWSLVIVIAIAWGAIPLAAIAFVSGIAVTVAVLHALRSFGTHRFEDHGKQRTFEEQFLESINVTGHPIWTELWAPVGLRYHALHHIAPGVPYHALGELHARLLAALPADDSYRSVTYARWKDVFEHRPA